MTSVRVAALTVLLAAAAGRLVACTGDARSLGDALTPVATSLVQGDAVACAPLDGGAMAHPNVCCQASAAGATCGRYLSAPFAACPASYLVYPDPRSCCPVDDPDPARCVAQSPSAAGTAACFYACAPGAYASDGGSCCSPGDAGAEPVCAVAAFVCNPGVCPSGETCPSTCPAPAESCGACASGFTTPDAGAPLCCRVSPALGLECYSRATGVLGPLTVDASADAAVPPPADGGPPIVDAGVTPPPADAIFGAPPVDAGMAPSMDASG